MNITACLLIYVKTYICVILPWFYQRDDGAVKLVGHYVHRLQIEVIIDHHSVHIDHQIYGSLFIVSPFHVRRSQRLDIP